MGIEVVLNPNIIWILHFFVETLDWMPFIKRELSLFPQN